MSLKNMVTAVKNVAYTKICAVFVCPVKPLHCTVYQATFLVVAEFFIHQLCRHLLSLPAIQPIVKQL